MKAQETLTHFADLERAARDLSQPPRPPRQRSDIIMCDWIGEWLVSHPSALSHTLKSPSSGGAAPSTEARPKRKPPFPPP